MPTPLTAYDRPKVALMNLLAGQPLAAGQALWSPNQLAPGRRESFEEKTGLTGIPKFLVGLSSNPLVVMGLILSMKYPIGKAKDLLRWKMDAAGKAKRAGVVLRNVGSLQTTMGGSKIPGYADDVFGHVAKFEERHGRPMSEAVEKFFQTTGRDMTQAEMTRQALHMEAQALRGNDFQKAWKLSRPLWKGRLDGPGLAMAESQRVQQGKMFDDVFGTEPAQTTTIRILRKAAGRLRKADPRRIALRGRLPKDVGGMRERFRTLGYEVPKAGNYEALAQELAGLAGTESRLKWLAPELAAVRNRGEFVKALQRQGFEVGGTSIDEIRRLRNYFPHQVRLSPSDFETMVERKIAAAGGDPRAAMGMAEAAAHSVASQHAKVRLNRMIPDPLELKTIANELDPTAVRELELKVARKLRAAPSAGRTVVESLDRLDHMTREGFQGATKMFHRYSTLSIPVYKNYLMSMGKHYAWTTKGLGPKIVQEMNANLSPVQKVMMKTTYIPQMLGRATFNQSIQSMQWADFRNKWVGRLTDPNHWASKWLPQGTRKWMYDSLMTETGPVSSQRVSSWIGSYFYTSALGFNFGSAMKNMLQTTLTTVPTIGLKWTGHGVKESARRATAMFKELAALGPAGKGPRMNVRTVFAKHFKEFEQAGMDPSPLSERLMLTRLEDAWSTSAAQIDAARGSRRGVAAVAKQVQRSALAMFQGTEISNRTISFYGAHGKAMAEGLTPDGFMPNVPAKERLKEFAMSFGRDVTRTTQFPAGPGQTPYMMSSWPGLLKQFLHFPLRYTEFLLGSTKRGTAGGFGPNLGTIGRGAATSAAVYEVGREAFGADLSQGLMWGALPLPMGPGSPFDPLPLTPPIVSLGGAGAMALLHGDTDALERSAPLLVPMGIQARRFYQFLHPKFADYKNRDEFGRIPLYTRTGSLIGRFSSGQLLMRSLGTGILPMAQEQSMMKYLLAQRDKIRGYRREYLEAVSGNDMNLAQEVQDDFKGEFPTLGPIHVKKSDLATVRLRKQIGRMERVLDTLPEEYRAEYGKLVVESLGANVQHLMDVDPDLLQAPNMTWRRRREAMRRRRSKGTQSGRMGMGGYGQFGRGGGGGRGQQGQQSRRPSDFPMGMSFRPFKL